MIWRKDKDRLKEAKRERDEVRRQGHERQPMIDRLEKRYRTNHFAESIAEAFRRRPRRTQP
jgi:hypothetical protein